MANTAKRRKFRDSSQTLNTIENQKEITEIVNEKLQEHKQEVDKEFKKVSDELSEIKMLLKKLQK